MLLEDIIQTCSQYSMISLERFKNNIASIIHVNNHNIEGDIVEIGVWKGGSMLSMMLSHETYNTKNIKREFHLYDTFEGMTESTEYDVDINNEHASQLMHISDVKAECPLNIVKMNISRHTNIIPHYHVGDILKNKFFPSKIAVLRLDTDWYESTKYELEHFYDLVSPGGIIIIDDYGHWQGCRKAVDEWLVHHPDIKLYQVDYTGCYFIKP